MIRNFIVRDFVCSRFLIDLIFLFNLRHSCIRPLDCEARDYRLKIVHPEDTLPDFDTMCPL